MMSLPSYFSDYCHSVNVDFGWSEEFWNNMHDIICILIQGIVLSWKFSHENNFSFQCFTSLKFPLSNKQYSWEDRKMLIFLFFFFLVLANYFLITLSSEYWEN